MNTRGKFSVGLVCMGLILALLPPSGNRSLIVKPQKLLAEVLDEKSYYTVDQIARLIVSEDSSVQIVDLRSPEEFRSSNIPGSINLPYSDFLNGDPARYLNERDLKTIFYSNGDLNSNYALVVARGLNYQNTYVMKGGLNEWYKTVMNTRFTGAKITPRENALFETRSRAGKIFIEMNSLPDSLKLRFFDAKHLAAKKLDGGCE